MSANLLNTKPSADVDLEAEFRRLKDWWNRETAFLSSHNVAFAHPAYRALIALGPPVIPVLLRDLETDPHWWFGALRELTGANPVPPEHRGKLDLMAKDWLNWGRSQGYSW